MYCTSFDKTVPAADQQMSATVQWMSANYQNKAVSKYFWNMYQLMSAAVHVLRYVLSSGYQMRALHEFTNVSRSWLQLVSNQPAVKKIWSCNLVLKIVLGTVCPARQKLSQVCGHGVRHRSPGRRYDDRQRGVAQVAISCITIYGAGCATDLHPASPACIRICILATPPDSTIDLPLVQYLWNTDLCIILRIHARRAYFHVLCSKIPTDVFCSS